jgi:uncharacterized protein
MLAMVHTGPSPGAPGYRSVECTVERAVAEAKLFAELGVDGLVLENMHDFPCVHERQQGPEVAAFMTRVAVCVKRQVGQLPVGMQVLFQANKTALAVALAAQCDFIRAEGWTYAHVSDKGIAEACAGDVLRYRSAIGADQHPRLRRPQEEARRPRLDRRRPHRGDGPDDGAPPRRRRRRHGVEHGPRAALEDLLAVREATPLPVLVGSGITAENFDEFVDHADGFIVGSAFKEGGVWNAPVCEDRVRAIVGVAEHVRSLHSAL